VGAQRGVGAGLPGALERHGRLPRRRRPRAGRERPTWTAATRGATLCRQGRGPGQRRHGPNR